MDDPINDAPIESIQEMDGPPENMAEATEMVVDATPEEVATEETVEEPASEEAPESTPEEPVSATEDVPVEETTETDDTAETPPHTEPGEESSAPPADEHPPEAPAFDAGDYLADTTEGYIRNEEDLQHILQEYKKLKDTPPEPQFASEAAKKVYDYANKFAGKEMEGAQEAFHILGLDIDRMTDKEKLYESMKLDESNKALNPQEFREWFDEHYDQKFGDAKDDKMMGYDLKREVAKAEKHLRETQQNLIPTESNTAEEKEQLQRQREQISADVERVTGTFQGLAIPVDDDPQNDYRFEVNDPQKVNQVKEFMLNPGEWLQNKFNSFYNQNTGQVDYEGLNTWAAQLVFQDEIRDSMYRHGQNIKQINTVKAHKNPSKPVEGKPTVPNQNRSNEDLAWDHLVKQGILPGPQ